MKRRTCHDGDMDHAGRRRALVTGAGSGIGRAVAIGLAKAGCDLLLTGRRRDALDAVAAEAVACGATVDVMTADLARRDSVDLLAARWGGSPLSILVLNAALGGPSPLDDRDASAFDLRIEVDLVAPMRLVRAFLPSIVKGGGGRVVGIASVVARFGVPGYHAYCASKAGLVGFCRALARDLAKDRIAVNAICPGWVRTAMAEDGFARIGVAVGGDARAGEAAAMADVPIGRVLEPEEVAGLVTYLCSDIAEGMTGQALTLDGGVLA